jgi:hypothetical protein
LFVCDLLDRVACCVGNRRATRCWDRCGRNCVDGDTRRKCRFASLLFVVVFTVAIQGLLAGDSFDLFCDGGWYVSEHTDLSALRPNGLSNGLQSEHRAAFVLNTTSVKLLGSQICKPVIHGFVGAACGIVLIARRVMDRSLGVRFRKRGAHHDSDFAANFVELEQISQTGNYVQLRGSVPLMWAQDFSGASFTPAIVESASPDHSRAAFDRHFDLLSSLYNGMEVCRRK